MTVLLYQDHQVPMVHLAPLVTAQDQVLKAIQATQDLEEVLEDQVLLVKQDFQAPLGKRVSRLPMTSLE